MNYNLHISAKIEYYINISKTWHTKYYIPIKNFLIMKEVSSGKLTSRKKKTKKGALVSQKVPKGLALRSIFGEWLVSIYKASPIGIPHQTAKCVNSLYIAVNKGFYPEN